MKSADSLTMFVQSAQLFLRNEIRIPVRDEVVQYMITNNFAEFSAAYLRHRKCPDPSSRQQIYAVIKKSEEEYNCAIDRARENARNIPV